MSCVPGPGLKRVLGSADAAWLVAGNMIGAGIFYTPGLVAGPLPGLSWPLVAWTAGGLLALCGAAVYAELGSRIPKSGGDYQYLADAMGPLWAFLSGWAGMLLTFSAAAAAMCIVAMDYFRTAIPFLAGVPNWIAAPLFVLLLTQANLLGARIAGRTTAWLTGIPLAALIVLFAAGLLGGGAEIRWPEARIPAKPIPVALGAAMLPVYFTYSGWNAAAYIAGELKNATRSLVRGLFGGTALVMLVYLAVNTVILLVVPADRLDGSTTAGADAARILLGSTAEWTIALVIAVAVLGSANVTLMAGSRIYHAMASDGLAPSFMSRANAAGVPSAALWVGGLWSALLATTGKVDVLVNWATIAILLLSSLVVVSLFVIRRRDGADAPFLCPGYPWIPGLYLIASVGVACASAIEHPRQSVYGLLIILAGLPVYWAIGRSRVVSRRE